jgi:hypothetical protein
MNYVGESGESGDSPDKHLFHMQLSAKLIAFLHDYIQSMTFSIDKTFFRYHNLMPGYFHISQS